MISTLVKPLNQLVWIESQFPHGIRHKFQSECGIRVSDQGLLHSLADGELVTLYINFYETNRDCVCFREKYRF